MRREINLLPESVVESKRRQTVRKWSQIVSILVLLGAGLVSAWLLVYSVTIRAQQSSVSKDIKVAKAEIQDLKSVESAQRIVKFKLDSVSTIMKEDPKYAETFQTLTSLMPSGVYLKNVIVSRDGELEVGGEAIGVDVFSEFLTNLTEAEESRKAFPKTHLKSTRRTKEGVYQFFLLFTLPKKG